MNHAQTPNEFSQCEPVPITGRHAREMGIDLLLRNPFERAFGNLLAQLVSMPLPGRSSSRRRTGSGAASCGFRGRSRHCFHRLGHVTQKPVAVPMPAVRLAWLAEREPERLEGRINPVHLVCSFLVLQSNLSHGRSAGVLTRSKQGVAYNGKTRWVA